MKRLPVLFAGLAPLIAAAAAGSQDLAEVALFTRVEGRTVRAAIRIEASAGWSLVHDPVQSADARAPYFELGGEGITWGAVAFPPPTVASIDDGETTASLLVQSGEVVAHALGALAPGADDGGATLSIDGQLVDGEGRLEDLLVEAVTTSGAGADALFAAFPRDLAPPAAPAAAPAALNPFGAGGAQPAVPPEGEEPQRGVTFDWKPTFGDRKADARFFVEYDAERAVGRIEIAIDEAEHYHLYHGPTLDDVAPGQPIATPTELTFVGAGIEWGPVVFPEPELVPGIDGDFNDIDVSAHHGNIVLTVEGKRVAGVEPSGIGVDITGQTCNDMGCVDYAQAVSAKLTKVAEVAPPPAPTTAPVDALPSLGKFLLLAVMWGLITLLMPCTYPMIPITISFFTKQAIAREGKVLSLAVAYGAGIVAIYVLIAVVVGEPIQRFANDPFFNLVIAGVFIFFAMTLFGWINLAPPRFMNTMAAKASSKGGLLGVFLMGLTLVVTSFTCTAPFVGSLLAAGKDQSMLRLVLGMGLFGLTMALPFVALSLFPSRLQKMPSAGQWMNVLKVFMGFVEIAAAMKFLSTADLGWSWGLISKELFLLSWFGIFLIAAMYLFGWINLKGEEDGAIGPGRMVGATASFLFALYCGFLIFGFKMDPLLTAFAPPYSTAGSVGVLGGGGGKGHDALHEVVLDDYEGALALAIDQEKLLLVNFTGWN